MPAVRARGRSRGRAANDGIAPKPPQRPPEAPGGIPAPTLIQGNRTTIQAFLLSSRTQRAPHAGPRGGGGLPLPAAASAAPLRSCKNQASARSDGAKNIEHRRKACGDHRAKAQNMLFPPNSQADIESFHKSMIFLSPAPARRRGAPAGAAHLRERERARERKEREKAKGRRERTRRNENSEGNEKKHERQ